MNRLYQVTIFKGNETKVVKVIAATKAKANSQVLGNIVGKIDRIQADELSLNYVTQ